MMRLIGLGSPFGDDTIAWRVIELLQTDPPPNTELVKLDRPGAALLPWLEGADEVVVLDALRVDSLSNWTRGQVVELGVAELARDGRLSSHQLDLGGTLALAEALNQGREKPRILGIVVGNDGGSEPHDLGRISSNITELLKPA